MHGKNQKIVKMGLKGLKDSTKPGQSQKLCNYYRLEISES
jgi:hypothetical protein